MPPELYSEAVAILKGIVARGTVVITDPHYGTRHCHYCGGQVQMQRPSGISSRECPPMVETLTHGSECPFRRAVRFLDGIKSPEEAS
jgi:hypothetical protein